MEATVKDVPVHYARYGDGMPVLVLHGAGVDHREMVGGLEPAFADRPGYRRIYADLPGMGRTPAPTTVTSNDDVVELLLGLVDEVVGRESFLVVGHSYGGYLARAIANRRPEQVTGLAVICSVETPRADAPAHFVLESTPGLDREVSRTLSPPLDAEYRAYLVVQTADTLRRFQEYVAPGILLTDQTGLERVFRKWRLSTAPEDGPAYPHPTLILAGRQDSTVGYAGVLQLVEHYPRATFAVLDRAGHALAHEQRTLLDTLVNEWLDRVGEADRRRSTGQGAEVPDRP